jgi:TRAP transporter T-component
MCTRRSLGPGPRPTRWETLAAAAICAAIGAGTGCSTTKLAVGSMVPILEESVAAGQSSADLELMEAGIPGNLVLLDGLIRTDPRPELLVMGARLYFSYAFAFVEDEDPDRGAALYATGRDYGKRALARRKEIARAFESGSPEALAAATKDLDQEDVPELVWTAAAWAGWANLNLEDPAAVADLPLVETLLARAIELDEGYLYGIPHLLLGTFHAARPPALGGDQERAQRHFARARELGQGNLLLVPVFEAKYYARAILDPALYDRLLDEALSAPLDRAPDIRLLNAVAQRKARDLQAAKDEYF